MNSYNSDQEVDMMRFQGKTLNDRYFLEEHIGEGGFAAVYKSEQQFLGRPIRRVAVKLSKFNNINIDEAQDIFKDAFMLSQVLDEATELEARNHIIQLYDVGISRELGNRIYVVMEFVQGTDMRQQFESFGKVPSNILVKWVKQICQAVKGLHNMVPVVLHRDLKPENILLGIGQNVKIIDFGLAAKLMFHGYVPGVAGTAAYMAPETLQNESVPASDVYSIGIILYEGLTGEHPFKHLVPDIDLPEGLYNQWLYNQKKTVRPEPPYHKNNTITHRLNEIIMRCLEFCPYERYPTAGSLLDALNVKSVPDLPDPEDSNLESVLQELENKLSDQSITKETRFKLLCKSGEVLNRLGDNKQEKEYYERAIMYLKEAWAITKNGAILDSGEKRASHLDKIADLYRKLGNDFQAKLFDEEGQKQRRPRGGK